MADNIAQRVFSALDQQRIGDGDCRWTAYVVGVHVNARDVWIQVATNDPADETVVVCARADATTQELLSALAAIKAPDARQQARRVQR